MKLHPRTLIVQGAKLDLERALLDLAEKHELTYVEIVSILAQTLQSHTKYALREERHPDVPDKAADIE